MGGGPGPPYSQAVFPQELGAAKPHLPEAVSGLLRSERGLVVGAGHGVAVGGRTGVERWSAGWAAHVLEGRRETTGDEGHV